MLIAITSLTGISPGRTQTPPPMVVELDRLLDSGEYDAARAFLRARLPQSAEAALHFAHFEGLILLHQGRTNQAIAVFREILAFAPNFEPSRVELAKALRAVGDTSAASYHFEAISLGSDSANVRRLAERNLEQIRNDRPYGFSGYFGFVPTTNVNRGTTNTTFESGLGVGTISPESREQSGLGVAAGGNGYYNFAFDNYSGISVYGSADIRKYSDTSAYDEFTVASGLAYYGKLNSVVFRIGPLIEHTLVAWEPYRTRYGLSAGASIPITVRSRLSGSLSLLKQDYTKLDYRNGWLVSGSATYRYMLSPSLAVSTSLGMTHEATERDHLDHNDYWTRFQIDKEWSGGLLTSGHAKFELHDYRGNFPTTMTPREDREWSVGGRVAHRAFTLGGFAPQLTYEYSVQSSNISFYDFESHDVGLTLTRNF